VINKLNDKKYRKESYWIGLGNQNYQKKVLRSTELRLNTSSSCRSSVVIIERVSIGGLCESVFVCVKYNDKDECM